MWKTSGVLASKTSMDEKTFLSMQNLSSLPVTCSTPREAAPSASPAAAGTCVTVSLARATAERT